jgi:Zn-dependent peptidase ImmA (M78 family)
VAPAGDLVQLLESEGVRTGIVAMPDEVSGLTISHPRVGLFVVVNRNHAPVRQRFSFCHEYAHVLLDRSAVGRISRTTERTDLVEVRANSFAANFLMPEEGVRQFVAGLGKGAASRTHTEIFDEEGVVPVDARTEPGTQDMQLYDVVQLGHFFGVSILSALFRLRNLKLVSESQFDQLRAQDEQGSSQLIASVLGIRTMSDVDHLGEFTRRFLGMALEAYRRERITKAKLFELAARIHLGHDRVEQLLEGAGLTAEEPDAVLLPGA